MNQQQLNALVCPLDWGIGHATRCIPIIRELLSNGVNVSVAAEGNVKDLLQIEFPELNYIFLRGYRIQFSTKLPLGVKLMIDFPRLFTRIFKEHRQLQKIIHDHNIHLVISDNRYGLWSKAAYSIFITHQPNIIPPKPLGFSGSFIRKATRYFIKKYNECWIPDLKDEPNLSGKLSHGSPLPQNVKYIGLLSRLDKPCTLSEDEYEIVAIISGPEPYRTNLERTLIDELSQAPQKSLLLRGIAGSNNPMKTIHMLSIVDHLNSDQLCSILKTKPVVICRGGYSTLMDLAFTGNKIICIPTPGQTEQQYLAKSGAENKILIHTTRANFSLVNCLLKVNDTHSINLNVKQPYYKQAIQEVIKKINIK